MKITVGDRVRMGLAPLHVIVGAALLVQFARGPRTPMVAVLGALFVAFGVYRLVLIRRALRSAAGSHAGDSPVGGRR